MKNAFVLSLVAAVSISGCGGQSATQLFSQSRPPAALNAAADSGLDSTGTVRIGINLEAAPIRDTRYKYVIGYFRGTTSPTSQVVGAPMGRAVRFVNVDDNDAHTASFLGAATAHTAPWPAHFDGSAVASAPGTAIGTTNFSTGPLNPHMTSALYNTGMPGFYMIGCAFHFDSNKMRTVVVVR